MNITFCSLRSVAAACLVVGTLPWLFAAPLSAAEAGSPAALIQLLKAPAKLQHLEVPYLDLPTVAKHFAKMSALTELTILPDCRSKVAALVPFPTNLGDLKNLRILNIGSDFDGEGRQDCDLLLSKLPVSIGHLRELEVVSIDDAFYQSDSIPVELWQLPKLKKLRISRLGVSQYDFLFDSFLRSPVGKHLASRLEFEASPLYASIRKRHRERVRMAAIPPNLSKLAVLSDLRLDQDFIEQVPPELFQLPSLRHLNLSGNLLRILPINKTGLPQLETLDISANRLGALPPTLKVAPHLQELNAADNLFDEATKDRIKSDFAAIKLDLGEKGDDDNDD